MLNQPQRTLVALLAATVVVADSSTPSSAGCVDPSGFDSCYKTVNDDFTSCTSSIPDRCAGAEDECLLACGNVQNAAYIGCWVQSCWNRIYSCDYQYTAITYLSAADRVQGSLEIPFYPPPENAPGGCVCNLGDIWGNLTVVPLQGNPCEQFVGSGDVGLVSDCNCCYSSTVLSNVYFSCPANDISIILNNDTISDYTTSDANSDNNCAILDSSPSQCSDSYSNYIVGTSWVNPDALPTGFPGTAPLSDTDGQLTSLDFDTYTLELFPAYTTIITPAAYNAKNAAETGSVQDDLTGTIKTSGSLVSGSSATGTVPVTALVPTTTATAKTGGSGTTTGSSGSASASPSKAGAAPRKGAFGLGSFLGMVGLLFM